jgi:kynurenine formamidase
MVHPCHRMLLNDNKKPIISTLNNLNKIQEHHAEWKKRQYENVTYIMIPSV